MQSARELAKLRLNNGLKELAIIAPTTRKAVVAVAGQNMPKFMDRAILLELGVPKDCIDKVLHGKMIDAIEEMMRYLAGVLGIGIVIGRVDIPMRKG